MAEEMNKKTFAERIKHALQNLELEWAKKGIEAEVVHKLPAVKAACALHAKVGFQRNGLDGYSENRAKCLRSTRNANPSKKYMNQIFDEFDRQLGIQRGRSV